MTTTARPLPEAGLSKSQTAYEWIRQRIENGTLTPGYRLVLARIAADLDMSAVPVREALRLLEAEGLVTFERNVGAYVAMIKPGEYVRTMETLALVEGAATRAAAPLLTAEDLADAWALNADMIESFDKFDPHRFTELNRQFHTTLFSKCPNDQILDIVHRCWSTLAGLRDSTFSFVPSRAHESVREHEALLQLIESDSPALEIELAARRHRSATVEAFITATSGAVVPDDAVFPERGLA